MRRWEKLKLQSTWTTLVVEVIVIAINKEHTSKPQPTKAEAKQQQKRTDHDRQSWLDSQPVQ